MGQQNLEINPGTTVRFSSRQIDTIVKLLKARFPAGHFTAAHPKPFEILIATVLSQRTKDENTNAAANALFARYRTPEALAAAPLKTVQRLIRRCGFYRQKAQRIKAISRILLKRYGGKVPVELDALLELPGVGRKTANCVLVYGYRIPRIPVDTHVHRISNRIGLVRTKSAMQTELELMAVVPRRHWIRLNELFVRHGQTICIPRRPRCYACPVVALCNYPTKNLKSHDFQTKNGQRKAARSKGNQG